MEIEVSKEEAEEILAKVRHRENKESFRMLAELLKKNNNSKDVVDAIKILTDKISEFLLLNNSQQPNVNVELNQDNLISTLNENIRLILKGLEEVKDAINKPKEWNFIVKRDSFNGYIESVKATMIINKPKYQA